MPIKYQDADNLRLHHDTARVLFLRLGIEQLALSAQSIAFRDQVLDLLAALQHALDGLVHDLLSVVQLVLNLCEVICLCWALVFLQVGFQFGVW